MSELLRQLRAEMEAADERWRAPGGRAHRPRALYAYQAWFHQACVEGRPPDSLDPWIEDEFDRFMSRTISGIDGHLYWRNKGRGFKMNNGKEMELRKWLYIHANGDQGRGVYRPVCGEPHCIAVQHLTFVPWNMHKQRYTDQQMIGAVQVAAMRLGARPSLNAYRRLKMRPDSKMIMARFGGWPGALRAAGYDVPMNENQSDRIRAGMQLAGCRFWTADEIVVEIQRAAEEHGPGLRAGWWEQNIKAPSYNTVRRRFGNFQNALAAAGLA